MCCRQQIRAALNQQTSVQFRQYALQQYPGSPEQVCSCMHHTVTVNLTMATLSVT